MPEIAVRPVLWTVLAIALVIAAVVGAVFALLHASGVPAGGAPLPAAQTVREDAPGLWSAPQDTLAQERRRDQARLESAGWVDRDQGIAHIPIADAMDLLVARRAAGGSR